MARRFLFTLCIFITLASTAFGKPGKTAGISPVLQEWDTENQTLNLYFNIENHQDQTLDLSYIIFFDTKQGKRWQNRLFPNMPANSSQMFHVSYRPEKIVPFDYFVSTILLLGDNYNGVIDRADNYFEIRKIETLPGGKQLISFSEEWPKEAAASISTEYINQIVWNLANDFQQAEKPKTRIPVRKNVPESKPIEEKITEAPAKKVFLTIQSTSPGNRSDSVALDSKITIVFSEPIKQESVGEKSISLVCQSGQQKGRNIEGTTRIDQNRLIFSPKTKMTYLTEYQAVVSKEIESKVGHQLEKGIRWSFTTKKLPKAEVFGSAKRYLKIRRVSPGVNGTDILTETPISILFDKPIEENTVTSDTFFISARGKKQAADYQTKGNEVRLIPKVPLSFETTYTVMATSGITDAEGRSLKRSVRWRFTTRKKIDYPETEDPNILIYSDSHEPVSYVQEKKGVLKIGITAFDPILHVDVNGNEFDVTADTQANIDLPYELKSKKTVFEITTYTKVGMAKKQYIIHYGIKPQPQKPPFLLISILGFTNVDNLYNSADDEEHISATKAVLTVVPQYEFKFFDDSVLRFRGILLRERYANEAYSSSETSYSQIAAEWEERRTFMGTVTGSIGWNYIKTNNENFIGENGIQNETFIKFSVANDINKKTGWDTSLEYKNKNSLTDDDKDAVVISLDGSIKYPVFQTKNKLKLNYTLNEAVGIYQDYSSYNGKYTLEYPIGDFTPSLSYAYKSKSMRIYNPDEGTTPKYDAVTGTVKLKYKVFRKSITSLSYKSKQQNSNLPASTYKTNSVTLDWTQIF